MSYMGNTRLLNITKYLDNRHLQEFSSILGVSKFKGFAPVATCGCQHRVHENDKAVCDISGQFFVE